MSVLVPPKQLVWPSRLGLAAGLWNKCIVALPFWSAADAIGAVPRDLSGNDVPVNLVGAPPVVATEVGYALALNGTSQAAWLNLQALAPAFQSNRISLTVVSQTTGTQTNQMIAELSPNFNNTDRGFMFFRPSASTTNVAIHDSGIRYDNPSFAAAPVGSWAVETATYEHRPHGQGIMRASLYRAGARRPETDPGKNNTPVTFGPFANESLNIGARDKGTSLPFKGRIAAILLHDRMLSQPEIELLGRDPFVMFRADPVAITALAGGAPGVGGTGAGALVAPLPRVSGAGAMAATVTGAGALTAPAAWLSAAGAMTGAGDGTLAAPAPRLSAGSATRGTAHAVTAVWPGPRRVTGAIAGARRMTGLWRATP